MDNEVPMQVVHALEHLEDDDFYFRLTEVLFVSLHYVHNIPQIHVAKFEDKKDAVVFLANHYFLQVDNIRVWGELL